MMRRRATTKKAGQEEDTSRQLVAFEDQDGDWMYLYDDEHSPITTVSTTVTTSRQNSPPALSLSRLLSIEPPRTTFKPLRQNHHHHTSAQPNLQHQTNEPGRNPIPLTSWLSHLPSSAPLATLSIPGTHNSCARLPPIPWVACQSATLSQQLNLGIRYFDFRLGISFGTLKLYHGATLLGGGWGLTFHAALSEFYRFLQQEPRECVILQIKHEGTDRGGDEQFEALFRAEVQLQEHMWALGNTIPALGAVRGKIQLMRRFPIAQSSEHNLHHTNSATQSILGIDVLRWADNARRFRIPVPLPSAASPSPSPSPSPPPSQPPYASAHLTVQDEYKLTHPTPPATFPELISRKMLAVGDLLLEARRTDADTDLRARGWYLNWCNAFAEPFSNRGGVVATPEQIALGKGGEVGMNELVRQSVGRARAEGGGERVRVGTVLLDFVSVVDPRVVLEVVLCNEFLEGFGEGL